MPIYDPPRGIRYVDLQVTETVDTVAPASGQVSPARLALGLAPGTLLAGMAGGIVFPIFPIVGLQLGLSLPFIGAILAANRAVRVFASPVVGVIADRVGGRRTLLVGLAVQIFVMTMYVLGIATHHAGALFLGGRLLHGIGSACVFVSAQALALQVVGPSRGGSTAGVVRASIVLGIPLGLATGGLLSNAFGDLVTFAVAAVAVCVALAAATVMVPDVRAPVARRPPLRETLRAMADRRLFAVGALNFTLNFAASGMVLSTIALIVRDRGFTLLGRDAQGTAGLLMAWMVIVDAAVTPFAGRVGDRFRAHASVACAAMLALVAGLVVIGLSSELLGLMVGLAGIGLGGAGLGPSLLVVMGELVPQERRGTGAGLLQLTGDCGGTLGPLVGTALFADHTAVPYLGAAALVACALPLAVWLASLERKLARVQP